MTIEQLETLRAELKGLVDGFIDNLIDDHAAGGYVADHDITHADAFEMMINGINDEFEGGKVS